ncbi:hypothetical protein HDU81_009592 [Chytriomyces hyalinus]|nr:hypothetical protein HDU81_009592 [Chytriomyces hyalinus]
MAFRSFLNNANPTGNACFDEMCPYNQNSFDQFSYGPDYFGQAGYRQGFSEPWMPNERMFSRTAGAPRFSRSQFGTTDFLDNEMDYRLNARLEGMGRPDMNANRFFDHPGAGLFQKPWMNALVANQSRNMSGFPMSGFMDEMQGGMPARMRSYPGMMGPGMMGPGMMGPGMMGAGAGMMGAGAGMMGAGLMGAGLMGEMGDMGSLGTMNFMRKRQESGGWY